MGGTCPGCTQKVCGVGTINTDRRVFINHRSQTTKSFRRYAVSDKITNKVQTTEEEQKHASNESNNNYENIHINDDDDDDDDGDILDDLVYTESEYYKLKEFVDLAYDKSKKWKKSKSNANDKSTIFEYIQLKNKKNNLCVARGTATIECTPQTLFTHFDDWKKTEKLDKMCTNVDLKEYFDSNRRVIHSVHKTPSVVSDREFILKEIRAIVDHNGDIIYHRIITDTNDDHSNTNDEKMIYRWKDLESMKEKISVVTIAYSVECKDKVTKGRVRGETKIGGYLFEDIGDERCKGIYLVCVDSKGWIPKMIINPMLKKQSSNILIIKNYIEQTQRNKV